VLPCAQYWFLDSRKKERDGNLKAIIIGSLIAGVDRVHFEIRVGLTAGSRNRFATNDFVG
jgi:hypothetical protein